MVSMGIALEAGAWGCKSCPPSTTHLGIAILEKILNVIDNTAIWCLFKSLAHIPTNLYCISTESYQNPPLPNAASPNCSQITVDLVLPSQQMPTECQRVREIERSYLCMLLPPPEHTLLKGWSHICLIHNASLRTQPEAQSCLLDEYMNYLNNTTSLNGTRWYITLSEA